MTDPSENLTDYYYILGVRPDVTPAQLEAAYRDLYDKFGPHVTVKQQDPESMLKAYKEINEAWEVLGDPVRRAEYDKSHLPLLEKTSLRNLWSKVAGLKTKTGEAPKTKDDPADTNLILEITLRESVKGVRKQVKVDDSVTCQSCVGRKPVDRVKCLACHGSGLIRSERLEDVDVMPGVLEKREIRLPGKGRMDTRCRRNGDLVIEIRILPHSYFAVNGRDVSCLVPLTIYEAVLGAEIEVPTPTGKVAMKIPPLTQPKRVFRLKGLGLGLGVERGDLLLSIEVLIPTQLHADEVELFRKLAVASSQPNPRTEIFARLAANPPAGGAGGSPAGAPPGKP
jgi:DnaJ-class molecular chaperone